MQNKEQILEIQKKFSRQHLVIFIGILIFISINLIMNNRIRGLNYVPCAVITAVLLADVLISYMSFFHSYVMLLIIRAAEIVISGLCISNIGAEGAGGITDIIIILIYAMFIIEFAYACDFTIIFYKMISSFLGASPFITEIFIGLIQKYENISVYVMSYMLLSIFLFFILMTLFSIIGYIQGKTEQIIFAKDRLIDRAKDNYERIDDNQKNLVLLNEQLGVKKYELEEANRKINTANEDAKLQNSLLKVLISSMDADELNRESGKIFCDNFDLCYAGMIYIDKETKNIDSNGIESIFTETELDDFYGFFLSEAFIFEHKHLESCFIQNNISYDEFPFFENAGVHSVVAKAFSGRNEHISGVYILLSRKINTFESKDKLCENIFAQMEVAIQNIYLYDKVQEMSIRDGLSGLYNRRYLNLYFNREFINNKNVSDFSVAMIDIDHFKSINDRFGHLFGDHAIKTVASIIREFATSNDGMAFRYGGEEFVVILKNKNIDESSEIMEKLRNHVKNTGISGDNINVSVTISIGLSSYPDITKDISGIIDRADKAMYYSKQHGRDRLTIDIKDGELS
ncbi:MAG: GGDEF domain-containing protein [Butyrivibrio sp.]